MTDAEFLLSVCAVLASRFDEPPVVEDWEIDVPWEMNITFSEDGSSFTLEAIEPEDEEL